MLALWRPEEDDWREVTIIEKKKDKFGPTSAPLVARYRLSAQLQNERHAALTFSWFECLLLSLSLYSRSVNVPTGKVMGHAEHLSNLNWKLVLMCILAALVFGTSWTHENRPESQSLAVQSRID